jgi:hypothetical protein
MMTYSIIRKKEGLRMGDILEKILADPAARGSADVERNLREQLSAGIPWYDEAA